MKGKVEDYVVKVCVVGNNAVGKTSLVGTYKTGEFPNPFDPEMLCRDVYDFAAQKQIIEKKKKYKLNIKDVNDGAEEYWTIRPLNYPNTGVFLVCFSLVDPRSFERVSSFWVPEVKKYCPEVPILLVGTKSDLRDEPNPNDEFFHGIVSSEDGELKANEIGAAAYIECSSKTNYHLDRILKLTIKCYLKFKKKMKRKQKKKKFVKFFNLMNTIKNMFSLISL